MMSMTVALALVGASFIISNAAHAWSPATHAYLAELVTGRRDPPIIFGAMMPDCHGTLLFDKKANVEFKRLAHYEFDRLEPSAFAAGFATHNALWGADYYSHLYYDKTAADIYSTTKIRQMSREFGLTMTQAEDSWEGVLELLIRLDYGPDLGRLIIDSANASTHEEDLVRAFAQPLSEKTGLSVEEAANEIRRSARAYQALALTYGNQLIRDEDYLRALALVAIRTYLGLSTEKSKRYLERGIEITRDDYKAEMQRISENVRGKMKALPQYAPYCAHAPEPAP